MKRYLDLAHVFIFLYALFKFHFKVSYVDIHFCFIFYQSLSPSWILFNLAGLYWRILGNTYHGIECVRRALYTVPEQYRDVPLVNLANMLYKLGRYDDAIHIVKDALAISNVEVRKIISF